MSETTYTEYHKYMKDLLNTCLQHTHPIYNISNLNINLHSKDTIKPDHNYSKNLSEFTQNERECEAAQNECRTPERECETTQNEHESISNVKDSVTSLLQIIETEIKSLAHPVQYDKTAGKYDIILSQDKPYRILSDMTDTTISDINENSAHSSISDQSMESDHSDSISATEPIIRPLTIQERFSDD